MTGQETSTGSTAALFDEFLVTAALGGDRRAMERLTARWHPRLLRTARRLLNDPVQAESAVQDCWLAILKGLPRLSDPARFPAWAFTILHRRCADRITGLQRDRAHGAGAADCVAITQPADERVAIVQAFARLPHDQRLAAHLHYREGLSVQEIAAVSGVPPGTVKSRLFHARRKLKAAFTVTQGDDA